MKLSDAIATGRVCITLERGSFLSSDDHGCLLAGAAIACGLAKQLQLTVSTDSDDWERALYWEWPWLRNMVRVPSWMRRCDYNCGGYNIEETALTIIAHTFDSHPRISVDRLIGWIRSVEPQDPKRSESESMQVSPRVTKEIDVGYQAVPKMKVHVVEQ